MCFFKEVAWTLHYACLLIKNIATIQGRAKLSCLTWSGITIGKSHHHPVFLYNLELFNTMSTVLYNVNQDHKLYMDATIAFLVKFFAIFM